MFKYILLGFELLENVREVSHSTISPMHKFLLIHGKREELNGDNYAQTLLLYGSFL